MARRQRRGQQLAACDAQQAHTQSSGAGPRRRGTLSVLRTKCQPGELAHDSSSSSCLAPDVPSHSTSSSGNAVSGLVASTTTLPATDGPRLSASCAAPAASRQPGRAGGGAAAAAHGLCAAAGWEPGAPTGLSARHTRVHVPDTRV
jgi:hypothetical protein